MGGGSLAGEATLLRLKSSFVLTFAAISCMVGTELVTDKTGKKLLLLLLVFLRYQCTNLHLMTMFVPLLPKELLHKEPSLTPRGPLGHPTLIVVAKVY
jgi:hypothetical protein